MTALTDLSDIVNRLTGGNSGTPEHLFVYQDNRIDSAAATAPTVGQMSSMWRYNRSPGGSAAIPGAAAATTRTTQGSLLQANPGGGRQKWMLGLEGYSSSQGSLILYDRLLHVGGLDATVTTAQTVGGTLTRYNGSTSSIGNQIWVEVYTLIGGTATTVTASYTNQAGTSGRTTKAAVIGGTGMREADRIIPLQLQDGDTGVTAIASVTLAATTAVAGSFGVTLAHPLLAAVCPVAGLGFQRDTISGLPSTPEILTDACLAFVWFAASTVSPRMFAGLHSIEA